MKLLNKYAIYIFHLSHNYTLYFLFLLKLNSILIFFIFFCLLLLKRKISKVILMIFLSKKNIIFPSKYTILKSVIYIFIFNNILKVYIIFHFYNILFFYEDISIWNSFNTPLKYKYFWVDWNFLWDHTNILNAFCKDKKSLILQKVD